MWFKFSISALFDYCFHLIRHYTRRVSFHKQEFIGYQIDLEVL